MLITIYDDNIFLGGFKISKWSVAGQKREKWALSNDLVQWAGHIYFILQQEIRCPKPISFRIKGKSITSDHAKGIESEQIGKKVGFLNIYDCCSYFGVFPSQTPGAASFIKPCSTIRKHFVGFTRPCVVLFFLGLSWDKYCDKWLWLSPESTTFWGYICERGRFIHFSPIFPAYCHLPSIACLPIIYCIDLCVGIYNFYRVCFQ